MKILYWCSTIIISFFLLLSSYSYIFSQSTIIGLRELGFPDFFRIQLAVLKIIATILILIPGIHIYIKDWAYSGIGIFLLTAFIAHLAHEDSYMILGLLLGVFIILAISRYALFYLTING